MKQLYFERSGLRISEIGAETWALGGTSYGPVREVDAVRVLEYAFDRGVTLFDTADIYGDGLCEFLIGKVFRENRDRIVLVTKAGYRDYRKGQQDFTREYLRRALESSLKRLQTDYVDIFLLHSPPPECLLSAEVQHTLDDLKRAGKTRLCGASLRTPRDGLLLPESNRFDVLEVTYNVLEQEARIDGLLEFAREAGMVVLAKAPLCYGFVTQKYDVNVSFSEVDHRRRFAKEQIAKWISDATKFDFLRAGGGRSMAQAALRFCMDHSQHIIPIPGMKTIAQAEEDLDAATVRYLSDEELLRAFSSFDAMSSRNSTHATG